MESDMAQYARVATFEFDDAALEALLSGLRSSGIPEGLPAKRVTALADRSTGKVIVAVRFDSEADLERGSAALDGVTPSSAGTRRRISVEAFEVALEIEA
jgi:hypothetical protein